MLDFKKILSGIKKTAKKQDESLLSAAKKDFDDITRSAMQNLRPPIAIQMPSRPSISMPRPPPPPSPPPVRTFGSSGTTTINRVVTNGNIRISNNRVFIDGQEVSIPENSKQIYVNLTGNVNEMQVDACESVTVRGDAGSVRTQAGDIEIEGDVGGNAQTSSGDISVGGDIGGNATTTAGDISAETIEGDANTVSGDIN